MNIISPLKIKMAFCWNYVWLILSTSFRERTMWTLRISSFSDWRHRGLKTAWSDNNGTFSFYMTRKASALVFRVSWGCSVFSSVLILFSRISCPNVSLWWVPRTQRLRRTSLQSTFHCASATRSVAVLMESNVGYFQDNNWFGSFRLGKSRVPVPPPPPPKTNLKPGFAFDFQSWKLHHGF